MPKKKLSSMLGGLALLLVTASSAQANLLTGFTFDTNNDGWQELYGNGSASSPIPASHETTGGINNSGYIFAKDAGNASSPSLIFVSPSMGDLSAYAGGGNVVQFFFREGSTPPGNASGISPTFGLVTLCNGASCVSADAWSSTALIPTPYVWFPVTAAFDYQTFGGDQALFNQVIANVTSLTVTVELHGASSDRMHLDEVGIYSPEPGTWVLLGTGLLAMGLVHRRRRKL